MEIKICMSAVHRQKTLYPIKIGVLGFSLVLLLSACNGKVDPAQAAAPPQQPLVKIAQPLNQIVIDWDEYTGRIEATNTVDVRARVGGHLQQINFTAGEKVKKGDLLFLVDPQPYRAQLNFANAELERARSRFELAKNDLQRAESLFKEKAISTEEFDSRSKGLREAAAAVASAEANVYSAKINLDFCEIRAPISGRIGRELITVGNLINGGDTTVLTSIVSIDPVYVYVDVDEQSVLKYRRHALKIHKGSTDLKGTPVELAVSDENNYPHKGYIDYVSPREEAATGTISLRGVFANPDELLSPGLFARVRVQGGESFQTLLVPDRAIATDQSQRFVWIVNQNNQVEYRKVELGELVGQMRIISKGIQSQDWVVIDGLQKLKPAITVNPEKINLKEQQGAN
jgi:multidrug efflux system membrane fusion protein